MTEGRKDRDRHIVPDRTHTDRATNQPTPGGATGGAGKPPVRRPRGKEEAEERRREENEAKRNEQHRAPTGGRGAASNLQPGTTRPRRGD